MPSFTIAPDMSAEAWLGAAGCARGSQTWSGTAPAFEPKPMRNSAITSMRVWADRPGPTALMAANSSPPWNPRIENPMRMATRPRWVMAPYQTPALRTSGSWWCSANTRVREVRAISSHATRKVVVLAAIGTSTIPHTNSGSDTATIGRSSAPSAYSVENTPAGTATRPMMTRNTAPRASREMLTPASGSRSG